MNLELPKKSFNIKVKDKFLSYIILIKKYLINIMKKMEFELYRNEGVYIKLTKEQRQLIKKLAKCQKKSSSDFVKWLIFTKYIDEFIK